MLVAGSPHAEAAAVHGLFFVTVMDSPCVSSCPGAVILMVKLNVPSWDGLPVMAPVAV